MAKNTVDYHDIRSEPWKVTLIDTGEETMTGGRLKRIAPYLNPGEPFCMTYGDGLSDIDIAEEIAFHKSHGRLATVACVRPPARFGRIVLQDQRVASFQEKPQTEGGMINGGFFVLQPGVLKLLKGDETVWENEPLEELAAKAELSAFVHERFWQPMDTLRDKQRLAALWDSGEAPWRVWQA
jgi:glucose-1-phosphate cytidylyltransferase